MSRWYRGDGRIIVDDGDDVYVIRADDPDHADNADNADEEQPVENPDTT
ncbi:hypothetical protein [Haloechinothrix sp. LS1_15]|nr:hypothetical protein [Haloechinothrix sp. LS1_15]